MRLAAFFFIYYTALGIFTPFLPAYYRSLGLNGVEMGRLAAIIPIATIFIPPIWGYLADRTGAMRGLFRFACYGLTAASALLLGAKTFGTIALVLMLYALFSPAMSALGDTLAVLEAKRLNTTYARIRLWGSIGFIVATFGFSQYLARVDNPSHVLVAGLVALLCACVATLFLRPGGGATLGPPPSIKDAAKLLRQPELVLFLLFSMVHWMAQVPYITWFAIHLEHKNIDVRYVGWGFALGTSAEVLMMWFFRSVQDRVRGDILLTVTLLLSAVRWWLVAVLDNGPMLAAVQMIHAFTFGAYFVSAIAHLEEVVPPAFRATGRALFSSVVLGLGGAAGSLLSGAIYEQGGTHLVFIVCAGLEIVAIPLLLIAWRAKSRALAPA